MYFCVKSYSTKDAKVDQGVHLFFISDEQSVKQCVYQNNIYIVNLVCKIDIQWYFNDVRYNGKFKETGHLDLLFRRVTKVGRKVRELK